MNPQPVRTHLPLVALAALIGLFVILLGALLAPPARAQTDPGFVDYQGFMDPGAELAACRKTRLIDIDTFNAMQADPDTIIIDARSARNYALGHIDGAVNFSFSDVSAGMLPEVIGAKNRRILIYCNNNFIDDIAPVILKPAPLALKVPTFINPMAIRTSTNSPAPAASRTAKSTGSAAPSIRKTKAII